MNESFLKTVFQKCKKHYKQIATLSLCVTLIICFAFSLSLLSTNLTIVTWLIICLVALPLLLSLQLVMTKIYIGKDADYNEIYKNYKLYFGPVFIGTYGVIRALIIYTLVQFASLLILYIVIYYVDQESFMAFYQDGDLAHITSFPNFNYYYMLILGLSDFSFFMAITSRMIIPFIDFFTGLPSFASRKVLKKIKGIPSNGYRKKSILLSLPLFFIYIGAFALVSLLCMEYLVFDLALFLGTVAGLICSAFYLPFLLTGFYTIADENRLMSHVLFSQKIHPFDPNIRAKPEEKEKPINEEENNDNEEVIEEKNEGADDK